MQETLVKYDNRKLYSYTLKKYINLKEVLELVENDFEITVVKYGSGDDVTNQALGEILKKTNFTSKKLLDLLSKRG